MSVVSIHQPSYFPWVGLLNKIAKSDFYILLDEVQLADRAYQHRNIFLDITGKIKFLTIPITKKGFRQKLIRELIISDEKWQEKHLNFLYFNYRKHPFFDEVFPYIQNFFSMKFKKLIDALYESMKLTLKIFDIKTQIIKQSDLIYDRNKKKGELMLELSKCIGANIYLSGLGAKNYMLELVNKFNEEGIKVVWNNFDIFEYPQVNSKKFIEGLSSLDMLFNLGIEDSRKLFWEHVHKEKKFLGI